MKSCKNRVISIVAPLFSRVPHAIAVGTVIAPPSCGTDYLTILETDLGRFWQVVQKKGVSVMDTPFLFGIAKQSEEVSKP